MRNSLIVGTAGHIDHGKTALIKHLTGTDADRLEEEKRRGITIDLGFAHMTTEDGRLIGFVDVPGHERFVKNMLAGAMGMDVVLMIISAEEGIMPQTTEHIHILSHLNIQKYVVVLTKSDLLAQDVLQERIEEIQYLLSESVLCNAPIVPYSIYDDQCKEYLIQLMLDFFDTLPDPQIHSTSRISIDRVFTMKGHGTVVTGTLLEGNIKENDQLYIYPSDEKVRVKGIQVYGNASKKAFSGQRVALNLSLDHNKVSRGDVVSSYENWLPSQIIDARISIDAVKLKHWQRVRVHHGTKEVLARIAIENAEEMGTGDSSVIQLRLETPLYCKVNDPIIIRQFSPVVTIGGGRILNPYAQKHKWSNFDESQSNDLRVEQAIMQMIDSRKNPFLYNDRLFDELPFEIAESHKTFLGLVHEGLIVPLEGDYYGTNKWWQSVENIAFELVLNFHMQNPLKIGIERETLRSLVNSKLPDALSKTEFQWVMNHLLEINRVSDNGKFIVDPDYKVKYTKDEQISLEKIKKMTLDNGVKPTEFSVLFEDKKLKKLNEEMVYHLINKEILVKINEEAFIHKDYYESNQKVLVQHLMEYGEISVAEYRDLLDISRKSSLQLLEHFDRINLTKRLENTRVLLNQ